LHVKKLTVHLTILVSFVDIVYFIRRVQYCCVVVCFSWAQCGWWQ